MSSQLGPDGFDFADGRPENADRTFFFPIPSASVSDPWSGFWGGLLLGLAGACLTALSPWLGGTLVLVGYGLTAYALGRPARSAGRSLKVGFIYAALIGAALIGADAIIPKSLWRFLTLVSNHAGVFVSLSLAPWVIALGNFALVIIFRSRLRQGF